MSTNPQQIDQLISDHLDGRLSEDQSQQLAELLRTDANVAEQLANAELDRESLRLFSQSSSAGSSLPADFAARVVVAARQRAIDENVSPNHPLRKIAMPDPVSASKSSISTRRTWVAAVATLAAAGLLVATIRIAMQGPTEKPAQAIAQLEVTPPTETIASDPVENNDASRLETSAPESSVPRVASSPSNESRNEARIAMHPKPAVNSLAESAVANDDVPNQNEMDSTVMESTVASGSSKTSLQSLQGAVLVYDVKLKPNTRDPNQDDFLARNDDPVRRAMMAVGLTPSSKQLVSERLIEATRESVALDENTRYQLLLLRAPASQLDRLLLELLSDDQSIQSVGTALAMGSTVAGIAWNQEAREAQTAVAYELNSEDDQALQQLAMALGKNEFIPMQANAFQLKQPGNQQFESTNRQDNFITEVLVIVR